MGGEDFGNIVNTKILNPHLYPTRKVVQDNCPVQNSAAARKAFSRQKIKLVAIPSKSPDINIIENFFNTSKTMLEKQAIERGITKESRGQFTLRVEQLLSSFSTSSINKLIDSLPNRMDLLIKNKGIRLRY